MQKTEISEIADEVVGAKKFALDADTKELERKIDYRVFQFYGLDENEIRIVEGRE